MSTDATDFALPNVGPRPDPVTLSALAADRDFARLLFQRDHYCTNCPTKVQSAADRDTAVVWHYRNKSTVDRPSIDDLLAAIDDAR